MSDVVRRVAVTALVVTSAVLARDANACSCPPSGPPCQAAFAAESVFAGTVRTIEKLVDPGRPPEFAPVRVTFDVDQPFLNTTERVVQLSTGTGGADCGYRFAVGRRYLVYASRNAGGWLVAGTCLRTRPIEDAKEDLEYLKGLPVKGTGGRVYGRVNEWRREPFEERGVDYGPLAGMTVSVVAPTFQKTQLPTHTAGSK